MKFNQNLPKEASTPLWVWVLVIAAGVGIGLLVKPLLQGNSSDTANLGTPSVRCAGTEGSELALSEFIQVGGLASTDLNSSNLVYARKYQLERPGQPNLDFEVTGDGSNTPLQCEKVRFGPGPRVSFARSANITIVELVGPQIKNFDTTKNTSLSQLLLETRWKLGLKLSDYVATLPQIDDAGVNVVLVLERIIPDNRYPAKLVLKSNDGGSSFTLDRVQSLQGF